MELTELRRADLSCSDGVAYVWDVRYPDGVHEEATILFRGHDGDDERRPEIARRVAWARFLARASRSGLTANVLEVRRIGGRDDRVRSVRNAHV